MRRKGCHGYRLLSFFSLNRGSLLSAVGRCGSAGVGGDILSHAVDGGADSASGLLLRDRLGQNQFGAQAKSSGKSGAAIHDGDGDGVVAAVSAAANIKDQLGRRQIFACLLYTSDAADE